MKELALSVLVLAFYASPHAFDIRQVPYTDRVEQTRAETCKNFVIHTGIPSVPPLQAAKRNPPIALRMSKDMAAAPVKVSSLEPAAFVKPVLTSVSTTVMFGLNRSRLSAAEKEKLHAFVESAEKTLRHGRRAEVKVHGYTCDLGTFSINQRLAERRARTVASLLAARGIEPTTVTGAGKCCYVTGHELRHKNRRVEITITGEHS